MVATTYGRLASGSGSRNANRRATTRSMLPSTGVARAPKAIAAIFDGRFPEREADLLTLPGIGPYTAAAIAAIAFGARATPVDGNIERVIARLFAVRAPLPEAKRQLRDLAETITPRKRAGDFAQAAMDLGATICTPKRPSCLMCPLQDVCAAHAIGVEAELPYRPAKAAKPELGLRCACRKRSRRASSLCSPPAAGGGPP